MHVLIPSNAHSEADMLFTGDYHTFLFVIRVTTLPVDAGSQRFDLHHAFSLTVANSYLSRRAIDLSKVRLGEVREPDIFEGAL